MARHKAFDREAVLERAMQLFWRQGFAATSTDDLIAAMGIGRQSLYDTFGDKQSLYLEALRRYHAEAAAAGRCDAADPLARIAAGLCAPIDKPAERLTMGCMGINATSSFGQSDARISGMAAVTARTREAQFADDVTAAQREGTLSAGIDAEAAAQFLYMALQGLTVRMQAGMTRAAAEAAVDFTMNALKAM
jgi:TetR/AcrR family transcriptional repressor of nem operon